MTKRQFISDVITFQEIDKWVDGEKYLVEAQTGAGKSHWVKNILYEYAKERNERILLLSNRSILKDQNEIDLGEEKLKTIKVANYQYLENQIYNKDKTLEYFFNNFKYIVLDEIHYTNFDSSFNRYSDEILKSIISPPSNKILILITATSQILKKYNIFKKENIYTIPSDYSYIEKVYFYNKPETPEAILQNMPVGEKAIYFGDAKQSWQLSTKFDDVSFVCSPGNKRYYKTAMQTTIKEIVEKSSFSSSILTTTKFLDNGVNIKDESIKTIIIDTLESICFLQSLGRKRVMNENDTIKLYVMNQDNSTVAFNLRSINKDISSLADFEKMSKEEFIKRYKKINFSDAIDNDMTINLSKKQLLLFLKEEYEEMLEHPDGYKLKILSLLGIKNFVFETKYNRNKQENEKRLIYNNGDTENEKLALGQLLEKYLNIELNSVQQKEFKLAFFNNIFSPRRKDLEHRGMRSINSILEEDGLQYRITSVEHRISNGKRGTFWIVIRYG